jgi:hypothetical protein
MTARLRIAPVLALGLGLLASTVPGEPARADERAIHLEAAWARRAPAMPGGAHGSGNGAVYLTIRNTGAAADALLAASTDAARTVELHETRLEDGKMVMRPLPRFEVPAGARLELKPGSYHIMLLDLTRDLRAGETVRLRLTFERAGELGLEAPVR